MTLQPTHYPALKKIYELGIATGNATFETSAPTWESWDKAHVDKARLVAIDNSSIW